MICKICGNSDKKRRFRVREMMFGTLEEFDYFECGECGCLQIKEIPVDMGHYYPSEYYSYNPVSRENTIVRNFIRLRNKYALWGMGHVGKILQHTHPNYKLSSLYPLSLRQDARILDIGCGSGELLFLLREIGFVNLLGVDPHLKHDLYYNNGLKVIKGRLYEMSGKWDVIMFHHSFEHLPNPLTALQFVGSLLSDDGCCVIRIPTVSSYVWEKYRENWVELDAPRHLFLHSIKSMERLAVQANLKMFNVVYDSTAFQFWGSEQYLQGISLVDEHSYAVNPKNSIFTTKEIKSFEKKSKTLNEMGKGGRAVFYFKKNKCNSGITSENNKVSLNSQRDDG